MPAQSKATPIIVAVASAIGAVIGVGVVGQIMKGTRGDTFDKALVHTASELNKTLPMMVDAETQLDNVFAGPGKKMTYRYTLINVSKTPDFDTEAFIEALRPTIINEYRTNPGMKDFREKHVTMHYSYKDKDGVAMAEFEVGPDVLD